MRKPILITLLLISQQLLAQNIVITDSMDYSRSRHQSQLLTNGKVLVCGGEEGVFTTLARQSCELFDPATETWSLLDSMNAPRTKFGSMLLPNGNVLVFGGDTTGNNDETASAEIWDKTTGHWTYAESMNMARYDFSFAKLNDGRLIVAGGLPVSQVAEIYDPLSGHWTIADSTIAQRPEGSFMLALPNNKILFAAGWDFYDAKTAEIYDVATDNWDTLPPMNFEHDFGSAILLNTGKVLISGSGFWEGKAAELFDPGTNTFSITDSSNQLRNGDPMILLNNGDPILFGEGDIFNGANTQCIEWYDVLTNQWMTQTYNLVGTQHYTIHRISPNKIIVIGGEFAFYMSNYALFIIDNSVGISEMNNVENHIWPNPAKDWITFDFTSVKFTDKMEIVFYNALGVEVENLQIRNNTDRINIENLSPGIYFYSIINGESFISKGKLIKN